MAFKFLAPRKTFDQAARPTMVLMLTYFEGLVLRFAKVIVKCKCRCQFCRISPGNGSKPGMVVLFYSILLIRAFQCFGRKAAARAPAMSMHRKLFHTPVAVNALQGTSPQKLYVSKTVCP